MNSVTPKAVANRKRLLKSSSFLEQKLELSCNFRCDQNVKKYCFEFGRTAHVGRRCLTNPPRLIESQCAS